MKKSAYKVTIDLSAPETHRARVIIAAGTQGLPAELSFPVWTPGSYLVREYSRHVTCMTNAKKLEKNVWKISGKPKQIEFEVYGFERTVRTTYIDENYAVLIGASLLPILRAPFELELILPKHWNQVGSALGFKKSKPGHWHCSVANDDDWVDSPIVASAPCYGGQTEFRVKGILHRIVWVGMNCTKDVEEFVKPFREIAETTIGMFGDAPFESYDFLLHFGNKLYGGLEHRDSQLSQFDGANLSDPKEWDTFLKLIAHEYFHAWNVKALRPIALGPFQYFQENYTEELWFAEGLTAYFDEWIVWKAGLVSERDYWQSRLKEAQTMADGLSSQKRRSLSESSFDAWIRAYRPDEDSSNSDVSYYVKGALLAWCWDAHIQKHSKGKWTLAKLLRALYQEFGVHRKENLREAKPGYTRAQLFAFAEAKTGIKQATLVEGWVTSRELLPWRDAAAYFGVKFSETLASPFFQATGMQVANKGGVSITVVQSGSSAEKAGFSVGDEIVAINKLRVRDLEELKKVFARMNKEKTLEVSLARYESMLEKKLELRKHIGLGFEFQVK